MLCCGREQETPFCAWCGHRLRPLRAPVRRRCAGCAEVFTIPAERRARTDRAYCGNTCRTRAYRHRKAAALSNGILPCTQGAPTLPPPNAG
jgi:hypothetical protein